MLRAVARHPTLPLLTYGCLFNTTQVSPFPHSSYNRHVMYLLQSIVVSTGVAYHIVLHQHPINHAETRASLAMITSFNALRRYYTT